MFNTRADNETVRNLIPPEALYTWDSHRAPNIPQTVYYTFDTSQFKTPEYADYFSKQSLSSNLQTTIKDSLKKFTDQTGIKLQYVEKLRPTNFFNQIIFTLIPSHTENANTLAGKTSSLYTVDGTPATQAYLKVVAFHADAEKKWGKGIPWLIIHEVSHAFGLVHPEEHSTSATLSCHDTIMMRCLDFDKCILEAKNPKEVNQCRKLLPKSKDFLSPTDEIALAEQQKKNKDPNYVSPYLTNPTSADKIKEAIVNAAVGGAKTFVVAFVTTLRRFYLEPYLKYEKDLSPTQKLAIEATLKVFEGILKYQLFSLPAVVIEILTALLEGLGLIKKENLKYLTMTQAVVMSLIDKTTILNSGVSTAASFLGYEAGMKVIQQLPKIHSEPTVEANAVEAKANDDNKKTQGLAKLSFLSQSSAGSSNTEKSSATSNSPTGLRKRRSASGEV